MLELIKRLVKQGIISEEQLHEAMIETPDKQVKGVAETLHSLLCHELHVNPEKVMRSPNGIHPAEVPHGLYEESCCFYLEATMEDPWSQSHHKTWVLEAVGLMERLSLPLPSDLSKFIDSLVVTVKLVDNLLNKYPEGKEVLRKACGI